jgi:malic enzyme
MCLPAQVFPAVGLAAITTRASRIDDECFLVAAEALADLADPARVGAREA